MRNKSLAEHRHMRKYLTEFIGHRMSWLTDQERQHVMFGKHLHDLNYTSLPPDRLCALYEYLIQLGKERPQPCQFVPTPDCDYIRRSDAIQLVDQSATATERLYANDLIEAIKKLPPARKEPKPPVNLHEQHLPRCQHVDCKASPRWSLDLLSGKIYYCSDHVYIYCIAGQPGLRPYP